MNHFREVLKPVVIHEHKGLRQTRGCLKKLICPFLHYMLDLGYCLVGF